jgi:hypothetical protein
MTKIAGSGSESGSISQMHGSADPDPHQHVMDPQHCLKVSVDCPGKSENGTISPLTLISTKNTSDHIQRKQASSPLEDQAPLGI